MEFWDVPAGVNMVTAENIEAAATAIDDVFLNTPQYRSEGLSELLGVSLICKVETGNPIGCFKGRGVDWLMKKRQHLDHVVTATAGNFGQAVAYAGRQARIRVDVFSSTHAAPVKIDAMKRLDAQVHQHGSDLDEAKEEAVKFAQSNGVTFLEDGREFEITEGAGTIALELGRYPSAIDVIYVPVGNGALVAGIGAWCRANLPDTKVIGVCAEGAPCMEQSWRAKKLTVTDQVNTIADGIACRIPVPESLEPVAFAVDDMMLVSDAQIISAMRAYLEYERLLVEPAGAASLAAAMVNAQTDQEKNVVTIVTGSNVDSNRFQEWLFPV